MKTLLLNKPLKAYFPETGILVFSIFFLTAFSVHSKAQSPTAMAAGKALYAQNCMACHGAEGKGVPGLNPPLVKTTWVLGVKPTLINIVLKGMETPITVDGEDYENVMPAQAQLTDQQIADVLTYVRNSFGNQVSVVSAAEVKAVRAKK